MQKHAHRLSPMHAHEVPIVDHMGEARQAAPDGARGAAHEQGALFD